MSLITLDEAKTAAKIPQSVTTYDAEISGDFIPALTPVIEDITGPIVAATVTQTFDGGCWNVILRTPATGVTSVTENGTALAATDYTPNLASGIVHGGGLNTPRVFLPGHQNIVVAYTVGSATVPPNVKMAAKELFRFWYQLGRQGNRPGFGEADDSTEYTPSGFAVPRAVIEYCQANMRGPNV